MRYFIVVMLTFLTTDVFKILAAKQLQREMTPTIMRRIRHGLGIFFILFGLILVTKRYMPDATMDRIDGMIEKVKTN